MRAYAVTLYTEIFDEAHSLEAAQYRLSASMGNPLPVNALATVPAVANHSRWR